MHELMFRLKRAHLRAVEMAKPVAAAFGLTPARFDILHALHRTPRGRIEQSKLGDVLGLSPSTISKMLDRLEQLGLVRRRRRGDDPRRNDVLFTRFGFEVTAVAVHAFLRWDHLRRAYERIHGTARGGGKRFIAMTKRFVDRVARYFGDRSTMEYPLTSPSARQRVAAATHHARLFATVDAEERRRAVPWAWPWTDDLRSPLLPPTRARAGAAHMAAAAGGGDPPLPRRTARASA